VASERAWFSAAADVIQYLPRAGVPFDLFRISTQELFALMRTIAQSTFKIVDWGRFANMMLANDVYTNLGGCTKNSCYSVELTMLA